jgi:dTDP-4-amino-4,6-dideoxygalactose transaminase
MREIPLVDLRAQFRDIGEELVAAVEEVMASGAYVLGRYVREFEEAFAAYCGVRHCVGVSSGTDAILFALLASGVRPGAEVITTPTTYVATAEAIALAGARVVLVDVEEGTANMDPRRLEEAVTARTEAIVPVHLYGRPCRMEPILSIAQRRGLRVVEDCCQAHGAVYRGKKVGTFGDAAAFSFYPAKNLGACGDGGAVVTDGEEIAAGIRLLRDHGSAEKNVHRLRGYTGRLDALQAAVLGVKLKYLHGWNEKRREAAAFYDEELRDEPAVERLDPAVEGTHVYHLYVIRAERRDALVESLRNQGVQAGVHYPLPVHLQESFRYLGYGRGSFPAAETHTARCLSLPLYPEITREDIRFVCGHIRRGVSES